ncbi:hypothetical protein ACFOGJ_18045 [Marinibaculum pumilum]|uniref:Transcriptional regulator n=1 Tax=Marinibaculum pumilum TaxID=1766165 RepID=A0ABV7L497_9PROT
MAKRYEQRNTFRRHAKLSEEETIRLIYCFAAGISVAAAASSSGHSAKTVRGYYISLRSLLVLPAFNRWHGLKSTLVKVVDPQTEAIMKASFLDVLADCYFNRACYRNYTLGNRKTRLCRSCPMPARFKTRASADDAVAMIDEVHALYRRLGIYGEKQADALALFRERLIHTSTVAAVRAASRSLPNGLPDPSDNGEHSIGTLIDRLLTAVLDSEDRGE